METAALAIPKRQEGVNDEQNNPSMQWTGRDCAGYDRLYCHSYFLQARPAWGNEHCPVCPAAAAVDAMRVEVHRREGPTSDYRKHPLAAFSREDVPMEQFR